MDELFVKYDELFVITQ